jgi:pimeloyl-ACP methyl ester carboxylesterase
MLLRRLVERPLPLPRLPERVPCLVVAGESDMVTPPASARDLASWLGAEIEVVAGGHALPVEQGWEDRVARVHRWLITRLGASLLALYEEAIAERDEG